MKDGPERAFSQTLQDRRNESIGEAESNLVDRLFKSIQEAFQNGQTISDADRNKLNGRRPQPTEITETSEVIYESPAGAAALDETMQLPPAMELAQMGLGYSSGLNKPTPELWEGLGTMLDAAKAEGGQLSNYEQMLLLASLGIPAAALSGRAVGGLMSKLGVGSKLRGPKLGRGPSAMRDMGPQAGNITAGAIALQKLGRPIPGRIKSSFDKILGEGAVPKKGLASLGRPIPPRLNEKAIKKILKEYKKRK